MKLPTAAESVEWAKSEARRLPDQPTQTRKYLLMLLLTLKRQEERIHQLESQIGEPHGK